MTSDQANANLACQCRLSGVMLTSATRIQYRDVTLSIIVSGDWRGGRIASFALGGRKSWAGWEMLWVKEGPS